MEAEDYDAVAQAHHRLDELNGYDATARAGRLLHGLGFPAETHQRAVSSFSGGWRVRLNLARALMMPSDLLLRRPDIKKAELIEGIVYMGSPVSYDHHGKPHFDAIGWLSQNPYFEPLGAVAAMKMVQELGAVAASGK